MSITINWRPSGNPEKTFSGTSTQFETLVRTVGREIDYDKLDILRAMHLATKEDFYRQVIEAVQLHGAISIWETY